MKTYLVTVLIVTSLAALLFRLRSAILGWRKGSGGGNLQLPPNYPDPDNNFDPIEQPGLISAIPDYSAVRESEEVVSVF